LGILCLVWGQGENKLKKEMMPKNVSFYMLSSTISLVA